MKSKVSVSLIILILVNLLPIFGVIYAGWDIFEIVVLYWFENVVIGLVNVLKIITCSPGAVLSDEDKKNIPINRNFGNQSEAVALYSLEKILLNCAHYLYLGDVHELIPEHCEER